MIRRIVVWVVCGLTMFIIGCSGGGGDEGPVGPAGPAGPQGPVGPQGDAATASQSYVGAEQCGGCHEEIYDRFILTGHANALSTIEDGQAPSLPYDSETGGVAVPPGGYSWDEILYVVGGYGWMARFVDQEGFVLTGDASAETQYNFENKNVGTDAGWVPFHPGEEISFNCGACHTTGYSREGNQDSKDGIIGTWQLSGIQCEHCHGPGSGHSEDPQGIQMVIDRDSQLCGQCHTRGKRATIDAAGGFEQHNQQFSDLYNSKHFALSCVTCHDPHASATFADEEFNPDQGIVQMCESCHWSEVYQNNPAHVGVDCIDCHMPPMSKSAVGSLESLTGDIRSHQFAINTDPDAPQFSDDAESVMPYITLSYSCGQCHLSGYATLLNASRMSIMAEGYHTPPE